MASQKILEAIKEYENYITKNGIDKDIINAYCVAVKVASEKNGEIDLFKNISKRAKELIEDYVVSTYNMTIWEIDSHCNKNKTSHELLDEYYKVLKLEAPYLFHSYLLYLEKNRDEEEKFYFPKMEQLNKHGLIQAMQDLEDDKLDILSISMPPRHPKNNIT